MDENSTDNEDNKPHTKEASVIEIDTVYTFEGQGYELTLDLNGNLYTDTIEASNLASLLTYYSCDSIEELYTTPVELTPNTSVYFTEQSTTDESDNTDTESSSPWYTSTVFLLFTGAVLSTIIGLIITVFNLLIGVTIISLTYVVVFFYIMYRLIKSVFVFI